MKNRHGSYKKLLLSEAELKKAASPLASCLRELKAMGLSEQDFTTLYILLYLRVRSPKNWLQPTKSATTVDQRREAQRLLLEIIPASFSLNAWEKEKLAGVDGQKLFSDFVLKGIPQSVNRAMVNWYTGTWKIKLLERIPSSRELLQLQVQNTRCITLMTGAENCAQVVLGTRDPLSFVLHDLMHADQFFHQQVSQKGQLGFYRLIHSIYDKSETKKLLRHYPEFKKEFEYVASDMNAYVIHLFKCLKSTIYRTEERENYFAQLLEWWQMSEEEKQSSWKLNSPHFDHRDELILKNFFEKNQEILA